MAFSNDRWQLLAASSIMRMFAYDAGSDNVTATNYFASKWNDIRPDDMIVVSTDGALTSYRVSSIGTHSVAVEAIFTGGGGGSGAVDSVNGQTGEVVLDLEDVGASVFGAELAAVEDAAAARTKIGLSEMADLDDNEFIVGVTDDDPVPKTAAEVLAILGMASQSVPLGWELTQEAADGTYSFVCSMPRGGTVTGLTHVCASRSAGALAVQIGGVDVTGLTSITPSTSKTTTSSSGANTFSAGNEVTLVVSGTSDITGLRATLNITWG